MTDTSRAGGRERVCGCGGKGGGDDYTSVQQAVHDCP